MVDFAEIAALVSDVITDEGLGTVITLTSVTAGIYDTATGASTPSTTTQTPDAIIEDYKGLELMAGLVQAGDKKVSIPADALVSAPKPTDSVTIGSTAYTVKEVSTTEAGGVAILYVLKCRRA